jgi:group I intron endonuclease
MGYIYVIKNIENDKKYIGQTIQTLCKRWSEHKKDLKRFQNEKIKGACVLYRAMNKYGLDKFYMTMIKECNDKDLDDEETKYIAEFNSLVCNNGYNVSAGGNTNGKSKLDKETKLKIKEEKAKLGYVYPTTGVPKSEEHKEAIRQSKMGPLNPMYINRPPEDTTVSREELMTNLPKYMTYRKENPKYHKGEGYEIKNHPTLNNKYFTSKKFNLKEKYDMAIAYLKTAEEE